MRAPIETPGREHWEDVIPHRPDVLLQGFELFRDHLDFLTEEDKESIFSRTPLKVWHFGPPPE